MQATVVVGSLVLVLLHVPAAAQETYWVASRQSRELFEVSACGAVVRTIAMAANGRDHRSCHVAPDGRIWIVNFIDPTLTIVDPSTGALTNVTHSLGNPFDLAFDDTGDAWVSGGTGVVEYTPAGVPISAYPLLAANPLGITIDSAGNKWIAHRTAAPGSISQIDPTGGISNLPLPSGNIQPGRILAAFRGPAQPNHLWVIGDGAAQAIQLDENGAFLAVHTLPAGQYGSIACDETGDVWVGSFSAAGGIHQLDPTNGTVRVTHATAQPVLGLAFSGFGQLFATIRPSSGPSEMRRIGRATGLLEISPAVGTGTQSALGTRHHWALVVNQIGDLDGDGIANFVEVLAGSSPFDRCSTPAGTVRTSGVTQVGQTAVIEALAPPTQFHALAFATGVVAPGAGLVVPGFGCDVRLDLTMLLPGTVSGIGGASYPVPIPADPFLAGFDLRVQGVTIGPSTTFTNVGCIRVW